jgi:pimeloyl-ACP methyl ester carboxylesterase
MDPTPSITRRSALAGTASLLAALALTARTAAAKPSTLHRISRANDQVKGEVIFIHGLGGDAYGSWSHDGARGRQNSWPFWLAEDLESISVFSLNYDATPSDWLGRSMPLQDRSKNILALLDAERIGDHPLVFVAHSLGGLLAKQLIRDAVEMRIESWSRIARQVRGVVFLSTPHTGANLATFIKDLGIIARASPAVEDLQRNVAILRDLNIWYRNNVDRLGVKTLSFYEKLKTNGLLVVDEASADPGIARTVPIPMDDDHFSIAKAADKESLVYKQVKHFIESGVAGPGPGSALDTPIQITLDRIQNFVSVKGLKKIIYTEAGKVNGVPVYGRGQIIRFSLRNLVGKPLDILRVQARLKHFEKSAAVTLRYDALQLSLPHTRLPIEAIKEPLSWLDGDQEGLQKEIGEGRIRLSAAGDPDGKDVHQLEATVEARAAGLWTYKIEAVVEVVGRDGPVVVECDQDLIILLRGT